MIHKYFTLTLAAVVVLFLLAQAITTEASTDSVLLNFRGYAQTLPLSCESRSAVDVAGFWKVSIRERDFFDRLPKSDNPHVGFSGNVYGAWGKLPPEEYGVYAEPIAATLQSYGLVAEARYGLGLEGLRAELRAGRPVILWATPRMADQPVEMYTATDGQTVAVVRYEHTVVAVGYTAHAIYVVDSANGRQWAYGNESLLRAWDKLGQMSVVVYGVAGAATPAQAPPTPGATIIFHHPPANGTVKAPLEIRGTVQMDGFERYEVWYAPGADPAVWTWVSGPHLASVVQGELTPERLNGLTPGQYTLRVVAFGNGKQAEGRVTFWVAP